MGALLVIVFLMRIGEWYPPIILLHQALVQFHQVPHLDRIHRHLHLPDWADMGQWMRFAGQNLLIMNHLLLVLQQDCRDQGFCVGHLRCQYALQPVRPRLRIFV